jgi:hypothetical protein
VLRYRLMRAMLGVEAGSGEAQPFHGAAMDEVLGDNFVHIFKLNKAVPDGFGVDHYRGAVLALIEAAGLVGSNKMLETGIFNCIFECGFQLLAAERQAAWAGRRFVALIRTDKDVMFKFRHGGVSCSWSRFATANRAGRVAF